MPRIVVECESGFRLPGRDVVLVVDGKDRGKLRHKSRTDLSIEAGSHSLQARFGRSMSAPIHFRASDRETLGFVVSVTGAWRKRVFLRQAFRRQSDERFAQSGQIKLPAESENNDDQGDDGESPQVFRVL